LKTKVNLSQFQFKRSKPDGKILVLNERSYLMGEYSQRTGKVSWQRVVLANQKDHVESWLREHYPVGAATPHRERTTNPAGTATPHRERTTNR
jgi:hypothetical protein